MDGLEQAAMAFDNAIGNGGSNAPASAKEGNDRPTETMFGNIGELEVDEDSPAVGGGDGLSVPGERKAKSVPEVPTDEGDEDADEGDEDGEKADPDADDEDEDAEAGPLDDVYEVTIDGVRAEVPLREALDGYIRKETFDRRMGELGNIKQEIRTQAAQVVQDREKYIDLIDQLQATINALIPAEPDWVAEYKRDPEGAAKLQRDYNGLKAQLANLDTQKGKAKTEATERDKEEYANYLREENRKIANNNPTWKDPKVRDRDLSRMAQTAAAAGFTTEEIQNTTDSRMVQILLKAAKYDKLQENQPKPIRRGKAKPGSSGAGSNRTAPRGSNTAMRDLQKTGSVEAAGRVFTDLIAPRKR